MASEALLTLLREAEGWRDHPYICPAGKPTIGFGHTGPDVGMAHPVITREEGEALLLADVATAEKHILQLCPMLIGEPQPRIDAMISWAFNFGANRVKGTTLEKKIAVKDWIAAGVELRKWCGAIVDGAYKKLPGLIKRRGIEARWMADGVA
jgi:lysozyme